MVRSLLNLPLPAVLNIDIFSHLFLSLQAKYVLEKFRTNVEVEKHDIARSLPSARGIKRTSEKDS